MSFHISVDKLVLGEKLINCPQGFLREDVCPSLDDPGSFLEASEKRNVCICSQCYHTRPLWIGMKRIFLPSWAKYIISLKNLVISISTFGYCRLAVVMDSCSCVSDCKRSRVYT